MVVHRSGYRGDDTGSGDSLGLSAHGAVLFDDVESEVDLVSILGDDVVVEDLADPLEVVLEVGYGSGSGEHTALDGLSLHRGSCSCRSGVDVVADLQRHLGVGSVVGDHTVLLLLKETALVHHRQCVGTDLMPDGWGYVEFASILDVESHIDSGEDSCVPLLLLDSPGLVGVLASECEIIDGDSLEQGELDGVTADTDLFDLVEVHTQLGDQFVDCVHQDLVSDIRTEVDTECKVIHDVRTGERVALSDCSGQDLPVGEVHSMSPGTTGSDIQ